MTINIPAKIENSLGKEVRVYFNSSTRRPVYGHFVVESDYEDLKSKGFFRFRLLESDPKSLSKIYNSEVIFDVI